MSLAVLVGRQQPAVAPERVAYEVERARGGLCELIPAQRPGGDCHAANHQPIPGGQDFLVTPRPDARAANLQQLAAGSRQQRRHFGLTANQLGGDLLERLRDEQMPAALEIRWPVQAVARCEHRPFVFAQRSVHRLAIPHVELAFMTFRVGVEAGVVAALR